MSFISVLWIILSSGGGGGGMTDDSAQILFQSCLQDTPVSILAWTRMSSLWCCPSNIFSVDYGVANPPRWPEEWFWGGCRGVLRTQTMRVSLSWPLPEDVPVDPGGSWSSSAPSHWFSAPSSRCREASSCAWFRKPWSFFQRQQAGSMFHGHRGGNKLNPQAWTIIFYTRVTLKQQ